MTNELFGLIIVVVYLIAFTIIALYYFKSFSKNRNSQDRLLKQENELLKRENTLLKQENDDLKEKYDNLAQEYRNLSSLYSSLMNAHEGLKQKYEDLRFVCGILVTFLCLSICVGFALFLSR